MSFRLNIFSLVESSKSASQFLHFTLGVWLGEIREDCKTNIILWYECMTEQGKTKVLNDGFCVLELFSFLKNSQIMFIQTKLEKLKW